MPTDRHLKRYFSNLPSDVCSLEENKKYMSSKFERLKSHKNFFILMIDEIHFKALIHIHLSYENNGYDHHDQQFMQNQYLGS